MSKTFLRVKNMKYFKKYVKSAVSATIPFGVFFIIPYFLLEYGTKGLWVEAVLKGIFFSLLFGIGFVCLIFIFTHRLKKRAENNYLEKVKKYSLEEEILFHGRVAHRLEKNVYTDGVLLLYRDRLVYECLEYNVVLKYEEIVSAQIHHDFWTKLMLLHEFAVKRYDGKEFVFRSDERDKWIDKINCTINNGEI